MSGRCIDSACIRLFLWYIINPALTPELVLLPSVYIVVFNFRMCLALPSKLSVFIVENLSYIVTSHRSSPVLFITECKSCAQYCSCDFVGSVHQLTVSKLCLCLCRL